MPVNPLVDGVACFKCGYDLRGLPSDHKCPECGCAIAESATMDIQINRWFHQVSRGMTIILVAAGAKLCYEMLFVLANVLKFPLHPVIVLIPLSLYAVFLVGIICVVVTRPKVTAWPAEVRKQGGLVLITLVLSVCGIGYTTSAVTERYPRGVDFPDMILERISEIQSAMLLMYLNCVVRAADPLKKKIKVISRIGQSIWLLLVGNLLMGVGLFIFSYYEWKHMKTSPIRISWQLQMTLVYSCWWYKVWGPLVILGLATLGLGVLRRQLRLHLPTLRTNG